MTGSASVDLTVDGTLLNCKGAIARLEKAFSNLPPGTLARVVVGDVPSRIDLHAWAARKGHRVVEDARQGERFEMVIAKGGTMAGASPPARASNAG